MRAIALIALTAFAVACGDGDSDTDKTGDSGLVEQAGSHAWFQQSADVKKSAGYWYAPIR